MAIAEIPTSITIKTTGQSLFKRPQEKFHLPGEAKFGILTTGLVLEVNRVSGTASIIGAPYIVGENAFYEDPNGKCFKTLTPSHVDIYHVDLLYNSSNLMTRVMQLAAKRSRDSIEKAADMFNLSAKRRFAKLLAQISEEFGCSELPVTQQELSQVIGTSREAMTKASDELRRMGLLSFRKGWITVKPKATERLWAIANRS